MTTPAPAIPSAVALYPRGRISSDPMRQASPTVTPRATRSGGVIRPRSIEYWKKSRPASPSTIAPRTAAPRMPIHRSHSMRVDGGGGGAAPRAGPPIGGHVVGGEGGGGTVPGAAAGTVMTGGWDGGVG